MENQDNEPETQPASPWAIVQTRHDGWSGEGMACFCETLAETGLVVDACLAAGKSTNSAYSARRRNPVFAAAWEAALTIARERLADTLLARSIEGSAEQYYKDGELVGERRVIDSRLGLAILRRLDRMAETGSPLHSSPPAFSGAGRGPGQRAGAAHLAGTGPAGGHVRFDWDLALAALRSGDADAVAEALAMLKGYETHETHDPPVQPPSPRLPDEEPTHDDPFDRCWRKDGCWWTDFPPPDGFAGEELGSWGDEGYRRDCTPAERRLLDGITAADLASERAEQEAIRGSFFASLAAELAGDQPAGDPPPAAVGP